MLEAILLPETTAQYPTCIGANAALLQKTSEERRYEEYLAALAIPNTKNMTTCSVRGPFDPEHSLLPSNSRLRKQFRSRKMISTPALS